jgi:hypothetical protein
MRPRLISFAKNSVLRLEGPLKNIGLLVQFTQRHTVTRRVISIGNPTGGDALTLRRQPFHCADLDPALDLGARRIELMLKWSLLFCHQLVASETQLLHNPTLQILQTTPQFSELLQSRTWSDRPHIIASLRSADAEEILADQLDVKHGGANSILLTHQLSPKHLSQMERLKARRKLTLTTFYKLAPQYRNYVNAVQRMFIDTGIYHCYSNVHGGYASRVLAALDSLGEAPTVPRIREAANRLRRALSRRASRANAKRSELWQYLDSTKLNPVERDFLGRWALILPYNRYIAENDGYEMCYSNNLTPRLYRSIFKTDSVSSEKKNPWEIDSEVFFNVSAIQEIGRLDFAHIARIRELKDFESNLAHFESALEGSDCKETKQAMREHVKFLDSAIGDQLGIKSRRDKPLAVEVLTWTGGKVLDAHLPTFRMLPSLSSVFSRITDQFWLRLKNPRVRVLETVGESIIRGARKNPSE